MDKDMFSGLGQILKPAVRQAEETDTHLYLQKHERDQNRKKRNEDNDQNDHFDTEDRASVSVDALSAFITNMLAESGETGITNTAADDKPLHPGTSSQGSQPSNIQTAKAASAYAHAAETTVTASAPTQQTAQNNDTEDNKDSDSQLLHDLLKEIEMLKARNIQEIYIEKADTFQESLINAIMHAKAQ
jgi:hypothetical protein